MQSNLFSNHLMPLAIAVIMLGVGMNLKFRAFKHIFRRSRAVITGLIAQMVLQCSIKTKWLWSLLYTDHSHCSPPMDGHG